MPQVFKFIFSIALIWNSIYIFSYARFEKNKGNFIGFVGICILLAVVICLFSLNFITY